MTLKSNRSETLERQANAVRSHSNGLSENRSPNHDQIGCRAYEIYLDHGSLPGQELADWLQAEREIESPAHFMPPTIGEKHRP
jgi:hypothetical protein